MRKDLTELAFILDRSGSMSGLEQETIGGYNSFLEKQKLDEGECVITTVLFDHMYELLHDRINLKGVAPITAKQYYVRGNTALLDAIGRTIVKIDTALNNTLEEERAGKVVFVITTDGLENSSREYCYEQVKQLIERQKEKGWEFIFLGANMDAVKMAARIGISPDRAANYHADHLGVPLNYNVVSEAVSNFKASGKFRPDWKKRIDEDYKARQ